MGEAMKAAAAGLDRQPLAGERVERDGTFFAPTVRKPFGGGIALVASENLAHSILVSLNYVIDCQPAKHPLAPFFPQGDGSEIPSVVLDM